MSASNHDLLVDAVCSPGCPVGLPLCLTSPQLATPLRSQCSFKRRIPSVGELLWAWPRRSGRTVRHRHSGSYRGALIRRPQCVPIRQSRQEKKATRWAPMRARRGSGPGDGAGDVRGRAPIGPARAGDRWLKVILTPSSNFRFAARGRSTNARLICVGARPSASFSPRSPSLHPEDVGAHADGLAGRRLLCFL